MQVILYTLPQTSYWLSDSPGVKSGSLTVAHVTVDGPSLVTFYPISSHLTHHFTQPHCQCDGIMPHQDLSQRAHPSPTQSQAWPLSYCLRRLALASCPIPGYCLCFSSTTDPC